METNKAQKPEYIEHQENNNCQQFYGPISGCVFAMPGSTVNMQAPQPNQEPIEPITNEEIDALCANPSDTEVEPATSTDEDTDPHTNIKLRRRLLKQSYDELLKTDFNQGSDWYYIYRMMEDNTIYKHDYQSFLDDLIASGIDISKINKSAFTEISKRIQKDTKYPNWKVIGGKQQKVIDKGVEHARIAFNILFK